MQVVTSFERIVPAGLQRHAGRPPDAVLIVRVPRSRDGVRYGVGREKVPFVFIESKLPGTPYLAYYGMPVFESGYLGASLLVAEFGPAEVACFRFHRSGDALSNTASIRQDGFLHFIKQEKRACRLWVDYLYPSDCAQIPKSSTVFRSASRRIRHIIIFNSRAYIVAEYLQAHGMGDRILLGFDPLERNECEMHEIGLPRLYHRPKCETQAYRGVRRCATCSFFKTTPASADNYMSMDILTAENVNYYIDLPNE